MANHKLFHGNSTFCFNSDEFMKDDFDVDEFVSECRRHVQLQTLREDLHMHFSALKSAMVELINKDYADFVNLSSNLIGMDKAIGNLSKPLGQLKEEVLMIGGTMDQAMVEVQKRLEKRQQIQRDKKCLQNLLEIVSSMNKMEQVLQISQQNNPAIATQNPNKGLTEDLVERVASEFNHLQFMAAQNKDHPLLENLRYRIERIATTLKINLEQSLVTGIKNKDTEKLQRCLRIYSTIDKTGDAEHLFRTHFVQPYMEEVVSDHKVKRDLAGMYREILDFVPAHCQTLRLIAGPLTSDPASIQGVAATVRGYDFMVNAIWPEVVAQVEARAPSLFAPGNPEVFHKRHCVSMDFLDKFEKLCGSVESVRRLRAHPSYNTYMSKWSLPVYFQIRFQEIAGHLEAALADPFETLKGVGDWTAAGPAHFHCGVVEVAWRCLCRCWSPSIYLPSLCHRFWKLSLQLVSRVTSWLLDYIRDREKESEGTDGGEGSTLGTPAAPGLPGGGPGPGGEDAGGLGSTLDLSQLTRLISDLDKFVDMVKAFFEDTICEKMAAVGYEDSGALFHDLGEMLEQLKRNTSVLGELMVNRLTAKCSGLLRTVNDIPRLYRRTNKEAPSKASAYVDGLLKPVEEFFDEHSQMLSASRRRSSVTAIVSNISQEYLNITSDVLTSVKKMEDSLKRLKKMRRPEGTSGASGGVTGQLSDDDKIRKQLYLDVQQFGEKLHNLKCQEVPETYQQLYQVVHSAASQTAASENHQ